MKITTKYNIADTLYLPKCSYENGIYIDIYKITDIKIECSHCSVRIKYRLLQQTQTNGLPRDIEESENNIEERFYTSIEDLKKAIINKMLSF